MKNKEIIKIWYHIYGNDENSVNIVRDFIENMEEYEDNILDHPFCHESAHQSLTNIFDKNEKYLEQHKRRVEIFKIIWENGIKRDIINDYNYTDKYRLTALQRMLSDMPRKLVKNTNTHRYYELDFDKIDPILSSWIKENLADKYKLELRPVEKWFPPKENQEIYPADYYGPVKN